MCDISLAIVALGFEVAAVACVYLYASGKRDAAIEVERVKQEAISRRAGVSNYDPPEDIVSKILTNEKVLELAMQYLPKMLSKKEPEAKV